MTLQVACEAFLEVDEITCDCEGQSDETILGWIEAASDVIAIMTGGIVSGRCTDDLRPRGDSVCGCTSMSCCACGTIEGITLPGPNPEVIEILIDGDAFTDWVIVDNRLLVRSDGQNWPACQSLTKAPTEVGTFQITVESGVENNQLVKAAASEIVCQMLRNPPQSQRQGHPNTRAVQIAGVSISLEQVAMEVKRKTFLLPNVVRLLTVYAPDGPTPAVVYSPELEDYTLHRVTYPTSS